MHTEWTDQLSAYLDGELEPDRRRRLETHLAQCPDCARTLEELKSVVAWAASSRAVAPARDLWPGIRQVIEREKVAVFPAPLRRFGWRHLVAAGLVMAALGGGAAYFALRAPAGSESMAAGKDTTTVALTVRPVAFADQQYDAAVADLEQVLEQGRNRLDSTTVKVLEESLRTIDRAIAEARAAIQRDTANAYLSGQVSANMRRKLMILRQAVRAIAAES